MTSDAFKQVLGRADASALQYVKVIIAETLPASISVIEDALIKEAFQFINDLESRREVIRLVARTYIACAVGTLAASFAESPSSPPPIDLGKEVELVFNQLTEKIQAASLSQKEST